MPTSSLDIAYVPLALPLIFVVAAAWLASITPRPATKRADVEVPGQVLYTAEGQPVLVTGTRQGTNTLAIVSLVFSLVGFSLVAVLTGHLARRQIQQQGGSGDGIALAGIVIGYIEMAAVVILWLIFVKS